ncbi:MAG: hypothetical protein JOZ37_16345 [Actinobacteria bacterium]|nr:hypothetical protein [Actinomycetota bacterium]
MKLDKRTAAVGLAVLAILGGLYLLMFRPVKVTREQNNQARQTRRQARIQSRQQSSANAVCRRKSCEDIASPNVTLTPPTSIFPQPPASQVKPELTGLLDRQGAPQPAYAGTAVRGFVVKVNWSDLQPTENGPITSNNPIDQAVAAARSVAASHPGFGIKLRVYAGIYAPTWAKTLGGAPVTVTNPQTGKSATIGRFWTDAYGDAYDDLQHKLAEKYDTVPEVREVVVSRCTTFFAEPFIRNKGSAETVSNLFDAGYTTAADHTCHEKQLESHQVWQHTRSDLELNPYQDIEQTGKASVDESFTESMMQYCRAVLSIRCVLENNSASDPPKYPRMYAVMKQLGNPTSFQTATSAKVGDLFNVLEWAVQQGANAVELPQGYESQPPDRYADFSTRLAANPH